MNISLQFEFHFPNQSCLLKIRDHNPTISENGKKCIVQVEISCIEDKTLKVASFEKRLIYIGQNCHENDLCH